MVVLVTSTASTIGKNNTNHKKRRHSSRAERAVSVREGYGTGATTMILRRQCPRSIHSAGTRVEVLGLEEGTERTLQKKARTQVVDLSEFVAPAAGTALSAEGSAACCQPSMQ